MDKLSQYLVVTFCIGLTLALFSQLEPWTAETFGDAKEDIDAQIQAELDAGSCASYTPLTINNVLFCQCSDKESQKPNKCSEKYK